MDRKQALTNLINEANSLFFSDAPITREALNKFDEASTMLQDLADTADLAQALAGEVEPEEDDIDYLVEDIAFSVARPTPFLAAELMEANELLASYPNMSDMELADNIGFAGYADRETVDSFMWALRKFQDQLADALAALPADDGDDRYFALYQQQTGIPMF